MEYKDVILVGIRSKAGGPQFLSALQEDGFNLIESAAVEELPDLVGIHQGAAVVVYSQPGKDTGKRALSILSASIRHVPVIVLVDLATFEEYYDLMCQGAYDYFELEEDPVAIERAIRYAPRTVALSPAGLAVAAVA
jgi:DNA-binding NtrC family response regulator